MATVGPSEVEMKELPRSIASRHNPGSSGTPPQLPPAEGTLLIQNDNNNKGIGGFLDANVYATKKSIAQGMLDVALLTANASQLKYLLQVGHSHEFYTIMVSLISTSIILQILVGAFIVVLGTVNLNKEKNQFRANVLNNMVTIFIFMITVINIVISAFGMKGSDAVFIA